MGETLKLFDYDVLWLNSCFTNLTVKALLHRQLGRGVKKPVVLAPKGELLSHALQHKALKKKLYLRSADLAGLYDGVIWMAASRTEKENIKSIFGSTAEVRVVQDIPDRDLLTDRTLCDKKSGTLSVIFLSRISPVKNLDQALRALQGVRDVHIDFDIYGPVQDDEYWETCRSLMRKLPENIEANYGGVLKYEEVFETLKSHDLLFHPSQGESYGHVILEALAASCPVLIGDGTPWSDSLSRKAGWVVPCDDQSAYRAVLREAAEMDGAEFYEYCESAHELARDHILHSDAVQKMQNLFESIATQ
jgi:glycosyltransferase involved in cell wall biosynthesis